MSLSKLLIFTQGLFVVTACSQPSIQTKQINKPSVVASKQLNLSEWKGELISLPPNFAPTMQWEGMEELLFSPGMFHPEAQSFFSYAFVLRYPNHDSIDIKEIVRQMKAYFKGLMQTVASGKKDASALSIESAGDVSVRVLREKGGIELEVQTYDAFVTEQAIKLRLRVDIENTPEGLCVRTQVSPQPKTHAVWDSLRTAVNSLECMTQEQ